MELSQHYIDLLNNKIYGKYFAIIDEFIEKNKLLINTSPLKDNNYQYIIYCDNALKSANALANLLAEETPYVEMLTNIPYKKFTLLVNTKYMCSLYTLGFFRKQPIQKLLNLSSFIPKELELINTYHKLYNIKYNGDWDTIAARELSGKHKVHEIITGGRMDFLSSLNCVIIGYHAAKHYGVSETGRLQLLSDNIEETINTIKEHIAVEVHEMDPIMPYDYRLKKVMLRSDKAVIDVYNSCEYELVPYINVDGARIAHPYVCIRFFYLDYWLSTLMQNPNKKILNTIEILKDSYIPMDNFYGLYIDENTAIKNLHKDNAFNTYYPKKYFDKQGAYRVL